MPTDTDDDGTDTDTQRPPPTFSSKSADLLLKSKKIRKTVKPEENIYQHARDDQCPICLEKLYQGTFKFSDSPQTRNSKTPEREFLPRNAEDEKAGTCDSIHTPSLGIDSDCVCLSTLAVQGDDHVPMDVDRSPIAHMNTPPARQNHEK